MGVSAKNPYVGPRRFEEDDKDYFFGRDNEARQLLSMVISDRLLLFHSQSGAGKSSLINTRLRPGLQDEGFIVLPTARVGGSLPEGISDVGNIFVYNLIASLNLTGENANQFTHTSLQDYLQALREATPSAIDEYGQEKARVLIIDQFEEIVTTNLDHWKERQGFFQALGDALLADPLLWVVLTMREDHIAAIEPYAKFLPWGIRRRFNMQRMTAVAALKAITEPALKEKRPFTDSAAKRLVDNLRQLRTIEESDEAPLGEYVEPVQLQVVCYQLWKNLLAQPDPPKVITEKDLLAFGDVDAALAQFYETAVSNVLRQTHESELALRRWFEEKLITEAGTRGTVYQGTETTEGMSNETVRLLANEYLLRAEPRAGGLWFELVHDRFVAPILQANQTWRLRQNPLIQAAELWLRSKRRRDLLYKDEQLRQALESVAGESLEPTVQEFLTACQEAQSQRDLEQARHLADEQARRAEAEATVARRLRLLTLALIAAILVAAWFAYEARQERDTAEANAAVAEANATVAIAQQKQAQLSESAAEKARQTAEAYSTVASVREADAITSANLASTREVELLESQAEARHFRQIALAQSLSVQANTQLAENNSELAVLLGLEALRLNEDKSTDMVTRLVNAPYFNYILKRHNYAVSTLAFGGVDNVLASADVGGTIYLWSPDAPGTPPRLLQRTGSGLSALKFSPNGRLLAAVDEKGRVNLWSGLSAVGEIGDPKPLGAVGPGVLTLAFDVTGGQLAAATQEGTVYLWDTQTAVSQTITIDQPLPINLLAFSPDGQTLAAASGGTITVWTISDPATPLATWEKEGAAFQTMTFSLDGYMLAAGGADASGKNGELDVWLLPESADAAPSSPLLLTTHKTPVVALAFDPTGQYLASASDDGQIMLWNNYGLLDNLLYSPEMTEITSASLYGYQITSFSAGTPQTMSFSLDGQQLAVGLANGNIQVWRLLSEDNTPTWRDGYADVWSAAFSPDGQTIASLSADQGIRLWQAADFLAAKALQPVYLVPPQPDLAYEFNPFAGNAVTFNTNGLLAAADFDTGVYLWPPAQLTGLTGPAAAPIQFAANPDEVKSLSFSPDASLLATGGLDNAITVWDVSDPANPAPVQTVTAHEYSLSVVMFDPMGQWLASADRDGKLLLWSVADLLAGDAPTAELPGHDLWINTLDFSPDGQWLASGSDDGLLKIWDLRNVAAGSYQTPVVLDFHPANVNAVKFSPDGQWLASADFDGLVALWDTSDYSEPAKTFAINDGQIWSLAFSPDGRLLIASGERGAIFLLPLTETAEEDFVTAVCRHLARNLTVAEWQTYLPGEGDYRLTCPDVPPDPTYVLAVLTEDDLAQGLQTLQAFTGGNGDVKEMALSAIIDMIQSPAPDLDTAQTLLSQMLTLYPEDAQLAYPLGLLGMQTMYSPADQLLAFNLLTQAENLDPTITDRLPRALPSNYFQTYDIYNILDLCTSSFSYAESSLTALICDQALTIPAFSLQAFDGWRYLQACGNALAINQGELAAALCQRADELDPSLAADYASLRTLRNGIISAVKKPLAAADYTGALALAEELGSIRPADLPAWRANMASVYAAVCQQVETAVNDPVVRSACEEASARALAWDDPALNTAVCLSAGQTQAGELVQANCEAALATAVAAPDGIRYVLPLCTLQDSPSLAQLGQTACDVMTESNLYAGEIQLNQPVYGIVEPQLGDYWLFTGQAGQVITIRLDKFQSELDSLVTIYDPYGEYISEDDQSGVPPGENNALIIDLALPESGVYIIFAHGWEGSSGGYELEITPGGATN